MRAYPHVSIRAYPGQATVQFYVASRSLLLALKLGDQKKEREEGVQRRTTAQQRVAVVQARPHAVAAHVAQSPVALARSHHTTVHCRPQGVQCPQAHAQRWVSPGSPAKTDIFSLPYPVFSLEYPVFSHLSATFSAFLRSFHALSRIFKGISKAFLVHF